MLRTVLWIVVGLFPVFEIALAILKRADARAAHSEDRGSMRVLWLAIALGVGLAIGCQWVPSARLGLPSDVIRVLALAVLLAGLTIRWLGLVGLLAPITVAVVYRITTEERALLAALGPPYAAYCARTKRLFPGVI